MVQCYEEMVTSKSFPQAENNNPKVVIALDEAHVLYDDSESLTFSRASVFLRTIKEYSEYSEKAVWVVFASTTSKAVHFAPPKALCT